MIVMVYIIVAIVVLAISAWIGKKNEFLNQLLTPIAILAFIILSLLVVQVFFNLMCRLGEC
jgi:hypothetical protein